MDKQENEKWLDELICRTINTEKPQFDAEKWKQKYPDEYQTLISRREKTTSSRQPNIWRVIFGKSAAQLVAAAAVIILVGLLLSRDRQNPDGPAPEPSAVDQSPAKIVSMMSLRTAYQRGGIDGLDQQFRDALDVLGPTSSSISMQELLEGFNGS